MLQKSDLSKSAIEVAFKEQEKKEIILSCLEESRLKIGFSLPPHEKKSHNEWIHSSLLERRASEMKI